MKVEIGKEGKKLICQSKEEHSYTDEDDMCYELTSLHLQFVPSSPPHKINLAGKDTC